MKLVLAVLSRLNLLLVLTLLTVLTVVIVVSNKTIFLIIIFYKVVINMLIDIELHYIFFLLALSLPGSVRWQT